MMLQFRIPTWNFISTFSRVLPEPKCHVVEAYRGHGDKTEVENARGKYIKDERRWSFETVVTYYNIHP
jgi:hypothetical protein